MSYQELTAFGYSCAALVSNFAFGMAQCARIFTQELVNIVISNWTKYISIDFGVIGDSTF